MELVAVFPEPPPSDLARTLDLAGYRWKAVGSVEDAARNEPPTGWAGAVIACDADPDGAWALARALRKRDTPVSPVMVLVSGGQLADLQLRDELYDDFCLTPFHPSEVELGETTKKILADVEEIRPARVVFDSLSELRLLAGNPFMIGCSGATTRTGYRLR